MKLLLTALLALSTLGAGAQTFKEWQDPKINEINRVPMHTSYFAFENRNATQLPKEYSKNFQTLNGSWRFSFAETPADRSVDFWKVDFNDESWKSMPVPGLFELNGYGNPIYVNNGYAWGGYEKGMTPPIVPNEKNYVGSYRKEIQVPASWKGKQIVAHFGSVTSNMYLWVNGKFVGYSEDSKLAAEFDITRYVKPGEKNVMAFQVFRWCDGTYLEDQDFFRFTGVGRDCYMYARNKRRIEDIRVTPNLDAQYEDATLAVDMKVIGGGTVELELVDAYGNTVATTTAKGPGQIALPTAMRVESPEKWSAESPTLYTLYATLRDGERVWEVLPIKVGFRKIEIKSAQLLVNGQPILIKGVNRHEINDADGYVFNKERMLADIKLLKEFNFNAIRTCHYPDDPEWLNLCDEYGFYVVGEANIESHGLGYGERTLAKDPQYNLAHLQRNMRNVQCNYNHPSIIVWSLGNEAGFGQNFVDCYNWIKNDDKSRPVQYEQTHQGLETDIVCPMYYPYENCKQFCEKGDPRPLIQCEYAHAMGNSLGGFKEYWDLIRKYPNYQGGFIWDFADQGILYRADDNAPLIHGYGGDFNPEDPSDGNFCANGVFTADHKPQPHAYEVQYYYQNIWATVKDFTHGEVEIYNENFFTDLKPYYLEWELLVNGKVSQKGFVQDLNVAPQQRKDIILAYDDVDLKNSSDEVFLNIYFKLKRDTPMLPAGYMVAKMQYNATANDLAYTKSIFDELSSATYGVRETLSDISIERNEENIVIANDKLHISFDKECGFIKDYEVDGHAMFSYDNFLKPNFWRAPTDNDYGAGLQRRYAAWREPEMKLTSLKSDLCDDGTAHVEAVYEMPGVSGTLTLSYKIHKDGAIAVTEAFKATPGAEVSNLFRFGMSAEMDRFDKRETSEYEDCSDCFSNVEYYGRGPVESYADRKGAAFVGKYNQTIKEQFHPYIRPQETGNRTDLRYLTVKGVKGQVLTVISDEPFSASVIKYKQSELDAGKSKGQTHPEYLRPRQNVFLNIDKAQMGVACVNAWGAIPLDEYLLKYQDYTFRFMLLPYAL